MDLDFDEGTKYKESNIPVTITVGASVGTEPVTGEKVTVYSYSGKLYVDSPTKEIITVYSSGGQMLFQEMKNVGEATFNIGDISSGVIIVQGDSGWTKKLVFN